MSCLFPLFTDAGSRFPEVLIRFLLGVSEELARDFNLLDCNCAVDVAGSVTELLNEMTVAKIHGRTALVDFFRIWLGFGHLVYGFEHSRV